MNIEKFIDKNMQIENRKIRFEEQEYDYKDIICRYNDVQYSHLLILDLADDRKLQELLTNEMTYERYKQYERTLLEDVFFSSIGDTRFNIYLIMVIPREIKINEKSDIQQDFQYARKLFLYEDEVENYFRDGFSLRRYEAINDLPAIDEKQRVFQKLYGSRKKAKERLTIELHNYIQMENNRLQAKHINLLKEIFSCMNTVDKYFPDEGEERKRIRETERRNKKVEVAALKCIKSIDKLYLKSYRCYEECTIPFKRVNLLYGENGVGKTTILEGIEFGVTGFNRNVSDAKDSICKVYCMDENDEILILCNNNVNIELSGLWYNVICQNYKEYNELFHQFNYFNTNWVSEFAIEGKSKVNVTQLQKYLGIEKIENGKQELIKLYKKLRELAESNQKLYKKGPNISMFSFDMKKSMPHLYKKKRGEMIEETKKTILICEEQLKLLYSEQDALSLDAILDKHIRKIESIFKLLIAENEFSSLEIYQGEICARVGNTKKRIHMSQMSTGQKICLALSLVFSLFLSLEKAPNIVMLDEPVANLDDLHMLNLLDVLRRMAIAGTQIFFTTANPDTAKMFRRKFSFLEEEFAFFRIKEEDRNVQIDCEQYSLNEEEAKRRERLI